jgi:hypothetical protein
MAIERISDNVKIVKKKDGTLAIECISRDEVYILHLGNPVEFLEDVFRFYLTNWLTFLPTEVKERFRKSFKTLISTCKAANDQHRGLNSEQELNDV